MQPIHLHSTSPVTRQQTTPLQKQYALNEPEMPKGNGTPKALHAIFNYLYGSPRYSRPLGEKDLSGLFLYDVAYLAGAYIPRVWYGNVNLPEKLHLVDNNDLYDWIGKEGREFGWHQVTDLITAQEYANVGHLVVITAAARPRRRSGRLSIIVPDLTMASPKEIPVQCRPGKQMFIELDWYNKPVYDGWKIYVNFLK